MFRISWLSLFLCTVGYSTAHAIDFHRGMSYVGWNRDAFLSSRSTQSIQNMKAVGIDWAGINVIWFQDTEISTVIREDFNRYSMSKASVTKGIQDCHAAGIKVMFKPMIDCRNGKWRGEIVPSPAWFAAYEQYIVEWARFAAEQNVEMFCIGTEYAKADSGIMSNGENVESYWRKIAAEVRKVYSGPITYAANHGDETTVKWWDTVDAIGIDAYYVLSNKLNPTLQELVTLWNQHAKRIETWIGRTWPGREVLFTEIGYRSYDGANRMPWDWENNDPTQFDMQEQVDCYDAALQVLTTKPWFKGFYWWQWDPNPAAGGAKDIGFTVQNKPAQDLLADWYLNKLRNITAISNYMLYD